MFYLFLMFIYCVLLSYLNRTLHMKYYFTFVGRYRKPLKLIFHRNILISKLISLEETRVLLGKKSWLF